jgi:hypothetical protein
LRYPAFTPISIFTSPHCKLVEFVGNPYDHQRRIGVLCDAVLDNDIYNAHTMAVDTLWAGVPLLTWGTGKDMGGRVGKSILTTLGLPELVAMNTTQFESTAVRLAVDEAFYMQLHRRIADGCKGHSAVAGGKAGGKAGVKKERCAGESCAAGAAGVGEEGEGVGGAGTGEVLNPFWDTALYVRHLEQGYVLAFERFMAGEGPAHLEVSSVLAFNGT